MFSAIRERHQKAAALVSGLAVICFWLAYAAYTHAILAQWRYALVLAVVLITFGVLFWFLRHRFKAIIYIVGAGVLYGFVATLAKVVIERISNQEWDWLLVACIVALLLAAVLGAYFVQVEHLSWEAFALAVPVGLIAAAILVVNNVRDLDTDRRAGKRPRTRVGRRRSCAHGGPAGRPKRPGGRSSCSMG